MMNVNIYLEDSLAHQLNQYAKILHKPRNTLIREAVKEWMSHHAIKKWPSSILKFNGISDLPTFESSRDNLLPPKEDPFE